MSVYIQRLIGPLAFWSGVWLIIAAFFELARRGFVVHYVNTRWIWLVFGVSSILWIILGSEKK
jgi:hypothetical protein